MDVAGVLLMVAVLCQLILVWICIGGFFELIYRWATRQAGDEAGRPGTAIGLPATIAVTLNAAFLNVALLIAAFASSASWQLPIGLYVLLCLGFSGFAVSSFATMIATRSKSKPLIVQLFVSVVGLICVLAAFYVAGAS